MSRATSCVVRAVPLALLLILAGWSSAPMMLAVSFAVLLIGLVLFSRMEEITSNDGLAAVAGASLAIAVALTLLVYRLVAY